jgi:hypothetical protein
VPENANSAKPDGSVSQHAQGLNMKTIKIPTKSGPISVTQLNSHESLLVMQNSTKIRRFFRCLTEQGFEVQIVKIDRLPTPGALP